MKRLDTKEGQYGFLLGICIGIFSTIMGIYLSVEIPKTCTPSQNQIQLLQKLDSIELQMSGINKLLTN